MAPSWPQSFFVAVEVNSQTSPCRPHQTVGLFKNTMAMFGLWKNRLSLKSPTSPVLAAFSFSPHHTSIRSSILTINLQQETILFTVENFASPNENITSTSIANTSLSFILTVLSVHKKKPTSLQPLKHHPSHAQHGSVQGFEVLWTVQIDLR